MGSFDDRAVIRAARGLTASRREGARFDSEGCVSRQPISAVAVSAPP